MLNRHIANTAVSQIALQAVVAVVTGLLSLFILTGEMIPGVSLSAREDVAKAGTQAEHTAPTDPRRTSSVSLTIDTAAAQELNLLPVVVQDDIIPRHQLIADNALRALPSLCRDNLKSLYVRYDHPQERGLAGASVIFVIGSVPDDEFRALLIHECGHVTDLGGLRGSPKSGESVYKDGGEPMYNDDASVKFYAISWQTSKGRRQDSQVSDFASGYAMSDAFEDFAETYAYFVLQNEAFAKRAATNDAIRAKYDFMRDYVFAGIPDIAKGKQKVGPNPTWDVTRLGYEWLN